MSKLFFILLWSCAFFVSTERIGQGARPRMVMATIQTVDIAGAPPAVPRGTFEGTSTLFVILSVVILLFFFFCYRIFA